MALISSPKYLETIIDYKLFLYPNEIESDLNRILLSKIKSEIGDKCYKNGYIIKDSINILKRSLATIKSSNFNGNLIFNLKLSAHLINPMNGEIVECKVVGKNKIGILAVNKPLTIVLTNLNNNNNYDYINIGDTIKVKIICSKFKYKDSEISVIGELYE